MAVRFFKKAKLGNKIKLHKGDAVKVIPELNGKFDLVFIDGDKQEYPLYYKLVFEKIRKGGIIIADNVLWSGKVTKNKKDKDSAALDKFNKIILKDKRVENILIPIRDGLMVARKI